MGSKMKIKNSFVTNSSSTSFIIVQPEGSPMPTELIIKIKLDSLTDLSNENDFKDIEPVLIRAGLYEEIKAKMDAGYVISQLWLDRDTWAIIDSANVTDKFGVTLDIFGIDS